MDKYRERARKMKTPSTKGLEKVVNQSLRWIKKAEKLLVNAYGEDPLTLHLNLKKEWYQMIESGEKKEEYREIKPYWIKRLTNKLQAEFADLDLNAPSDYYAEYIPFQRVYIHYGYTKRMMAFQIKSIDINYGRTEWGAQLGQVYFVISLGDRIV